MKNSQASRRQGDGRNAESVCRENFRRAMKAAVRARRFSAFPRKKRRRPARSTPRLNRFQARPVQSTARTHAPQGRPVFSAALYAYAPHNSHLPQHVFQKGKIRNYFGIFSGFRERMRRLRGLRQMAQKRPKLHFRDFAGTLQRNGPVSLPRSHGRRFCARHGQAGASASTPPHRAATKPAPPAFPDHCRRRGM